ncbi:glycosyl hydrolase family 95 catalytic domain-containing protein [Paenibacillus eucommiae]|uniref:Alpha-L-fucosidase 2 n=1 Tax=Paenibacillus eucommiae TaxID=1355755 RepID=A0ABS4IMB0_9BACL|nr:hypothetical protein [Paenibacillus eucommiae]MBP1988648.1 alpha-L-fucosidase 2 [Paenibacillus eucommiae]
MEIAGIRSVPKWPGDKHALRFTDPITRWDEALPLGNGLTGCLLWGDGAPLRFSLDRGDLWDTRQAPETLAGDFTYAELIVLVRQQDQEAIERRFDSFFSLYPYPTKLPAGRLELDYGCAARRVESSLSLADAVAEVRLEYTCTAVNDETTNSQSNSKSDYYSDRRLDRQSDSLSNSDSDRQSDHKSERKSDSRQSDKQSDKQSHVRSYLHAVNGLGYIRVKGMAEQVNLRLVPPDFTGQAAEREDKHSSFNISLASLGIPAAVHGEDGNVRWFRQPTCEALEYAIVVASRRTEADEVEYVYQVASSIDGEDWLNMAISHVRSAVEEGFDIALKEHVEWWQRFWSKSSVSLPDTDAESMWYMANYFLGSSSRQGSPPMPLQGVWTADEGLLPPWKGDYHNDLNLQMNYWHYMKANHLDEGASYLDFLWKLLPQGRVFAKEFYDAPGINLPSVMTIEGKPLGGWPMYSLSIANQMWTCQAFDHYWRYTGDEDFLREKMVVIFRETAHCVLRWLTEGEDGKLRLPVSSSPEIYNNTLQAWLTPNSNYDLSLMRYLFGRLVWMADYLQDEEGLKLWRHTLEKLPELAVSQGNELMLSPDQPFFESHRHFSHAMAIYPLKQLRYYGYGSLECSERLEKERAIIDATVTQLEILGKGWWVGYSFTWMAAIYAMQGNGEGAWYHLQQFWTYMCSPNGFHLNGDYTKAGLSMFHYRPFTLEANMSAADSLQEMLLQSSDGILHVFPAIPKRWSRQGAAFTTLRGEMGVLVSARMADEKLQYIELYAERSGTFRVQNNFECEHLWIAMEGEAPRLLQGRVPSILAITLEAGKACVISFK